MWEADLDVVPLVVVAALPEEAVVHDVVDVELIEQRITVLEREISVWPHEGGGECGPWRRTP